MITCRVGLSVTQYSRVDPRRFGFTREATAPILAKPIIAKRSNAYVIEINLEDTPLTSFADLSLKGHAKDLIPELLQEFKKVKGK